MEPTRLLLLRFTSHHWMGRACQKDGHFWHAKEIRGYDRMYMSETTAEFDVYMVFRVWTENSGLSADPFDFPVSLSAEKRSAGRFPPYRPLRRIRQCKLNRGAP